MIHNIVKFHRFLKILIFIDRYSEVNNKNGKKKE